MEFKVGELYKSKHTGLIYKARRINSTNVFLIRTDRYAAWTPLLSTAQMLLTKVESTEYPPNSSLSEITPDLKTQHCKLCILCQANPARFCDCNRPAEPKVAELPQIVLRQGWDNIRYKKKPAYLHMDSDTVIFTYDNAATRWYWNSKFDTNGKLQSKFADTALALMKQVEDYLQQSNCVGHNKSERR